MVRKSGRDGPRRPRAIRSFVLIYTRSSLIWMFSKRFKRRGGRAGRACRVASRKLARSRDQAHICTVLGECTNRAYLENPSPQTREALPGLSPPRSTIVANTISTFSFSSSSSVYPPPTTSPGFQGKRICPACVSTATFHDGTRRAATATATASVGKDAKLVV